MRCAKCGFGNPAGASFCEACRAVLARTCPGCGHEAGASAKFCSECGAPLTDGPAAPSLPPRSVSEPSPAPIHYTPHHLAERIRAAQAAMEARGEIAGERKTVTALFADMAGSTALVHDLDPEEAQRLIEPIVALMMDAVHYYEGYVAKSLGDGILALFGAPIAHEDHPQRALYAALEQVKEGRGQVVAVAGEAGVGKSRLFHEFKERSRHGCLVLETFSVSHGKAFAYLPLIELLKNYFQITAQDDDRQCRERVMGKALTLERSFEDLVPYLLFLLGIGERGTALADMDPQIRRDRTIDAIIQILTRESRDQPIELLFEDLQWLDRETEAFLLSLIDRVADSRILLLVNYRPEYQPVWERTGYCSQLRLEPLGPAEAQGLLSALLGDDPTLVPLKQLILEKTEGNPFFMEEVVQTLVEEKALLGEPGRFRIEHTPAALHIPTTVQGVLAARIDRLPVAEKDLLQALAVIGKEFSFSLIRRICDGPGAPTDDALRDLLARLEAAEFIYERPAFPEVEYSFKHGLTQEVAGRSLLTERRSALHERAAQAIEALFPTRIADYWSELAHHYRLSGNVAKAVEYLHRTGQQALQHSAHLDAMRHLGAALELLEHLPETPERAQQELTLLLSLAAALATVRGFGSPEVVAAYTRALGVCERIGETSKIFPVQLGLRTYYQLRAEYRTASELGERLLRMARQTGKPAWLVEAHLALSASLYYQGDLEAARVHQEQALVFYHQEMREEPVYDHVVDPGVRALNFLAWTLWQQGYPDQSGKRSQEGIALARKYTGGSSLALALSHTGLLHQLRRDATLTRQYAEAAISLAAEQGMPIWLAWGTILRGSALTQQGSVEEGIAQIREGLAGYRATGAEMGYSYFLALLADGYRQAGETDAGLGVVDEAMEMVSRSGEHCYEAELYRVKGLLLGASSDRSGDAARAEEAEACFHQAIAVARRSGARSFELRAVLSLARLWQCQGKAADARRVLAEVYGSFAEGFDTADLREAKALLDALASSEG